MEPVPAKIPDQTQPRERKKSLSRFTKAMQQEYIHITAGVCTPDAWARIIFKAVEQSEEGDRYARDFLLRILGLETLKIGIVGTVDTGDANDVVKRIKLSLTRDEMRSALGRPEPQIGKEVEAEVVKPAEVTVKAAT